MTDILINAISTAIYDHHGDKYTIYAENVEQGLEEPCFFIQCINSKFTRQLGSNFFMENLFCIQYFPLDSLNPVSECRKTAESLFECLEYIYPDNDPLRGTDQNFEITDGVLNFFVNFNICIHKDKFKNLPKMNNLEKIDLTFSNSKENDDYE